MDNNNDNKVRTLTPNSNVGDTAEKKQPIDYESLRLMPVAVLDNMLEYIYSNNKEAFDMYFNLLRIKDVNKLTPKVDTATKATKAPIVTDNPNDKS